MVYTTVGFWEPDVTAFQRVLLNPSFWRGVKIAPKARIKRQKPLNWGFLFLKSGKSRLGVWGAHFLLRPLITI